MPGNNLSQEHGNLTKYLEYRAYLEKTGTLDALTRGFVALYEQLEKPKDALEFFIENLSHGVSSMIELEALEKEVADVEEKLAKSLEINLRMRNELLSRGIMIRARTPAPARLEDEYGSDDFNLGTTVSNKEAIVPASEDIDLEHKGEID